MRKKVNILILFIFLVLMILLLINIIDDKKQNIKEPLIGKQVIGWGQKYVGYDNTIRDSKVKVAILDSGININHDDLQKKVVNSYNVIDGSNLIRDDFGHGTNIAGIITANDNDIGIIGISQNIEIYDIKVLDDKGIGKVEDVIKGLQWALNNDVDIINISFGFIKNYPELQYMINTLLSKNIIIVASAGNNIGQEVDYPARYTNVISVGSIDENGEIDILGSQGKIDIYAPGKNIVTTSKNGKYETVRGTSFSAAYVTGILAKAISNGMIDKKTNNQNNIQQSMKYLKTNY